MLKNVNVYKFKRENIPNMGKMVRGGDFSEQPAVMNGFSDLMVEVLGKRGQHARSAMGAYALEQNMPVTVEAIVRIRK